MYRFEEQYNKAPFDNLLEIYRESFADHYPLRLSLTISQARLSLMATLRAA